MDASVKNEKCDSYIYIVMGWHKRKYRDETKTSHWKNSLKYVKLKWVVNLGQDC